MTDDVRMMLEEMSDGLGDDAPTEVWQVVALQQAIVATSRYPAATYELLQELREVRREDGDAADVETEYRDGIQRAIATLAHNSTAALHLLQLLNDAERRARGHDDEPVDENLEEEHCIF